MLGLIAGGGRWRDVSADVVDAESVVDGRLEARLHVAPSAHVFMLLLTPRHLEAGSRLRREGWVKERNETR